ncbi:hypothetical protein [Stenotrophomonas sp. SY1]|jgi:hypothetical protein|uniref:hypothetical protein n=1 Tax=Stenotrophomonas sp. SY1 TaxID=477235 RepID=UPI001E316589|nr:hypothetical protein [Stenotrophomonas sp. SY1]MCD9087533.1 hypothetical protein [Stenotrophomonas sp. SY1]
MSSIPLAAIRWHDLPASDIRIAETGISLVVAPYNEASCSYELRVLRITNAQTISFNMTGTVSAKDLSSMEISTFTYSTAPSGRITGTIGLLPGQAGFWELSFSDAQWELADA